MAPFDIPLSGQFSAERCVFGMSRVCGSGLYGAGLAGLALSGVNIEGFGRTLAQVLCAVSTPLCSSVPLCFKTHPSSTWALEGRCRGRI